MQDRGTRVEDLWPTGHLPTRRVTLCCDCTAALTVVTLHFIINWREWRVWAAHLKKCFTNSRVYWNGLGCGLSCLDVFILARVRVMEASGLMRHSTKECEGEVHVFTRTHLTIATFYLYPERNFSIINLNTHTDTHTHTDANRHTRSHARSETLLSRPFRESGIVIGWTFQVHVTARGSSSALMGWRGTVAAGHFQASTGLVSALSIQH